MFNPQDKHWVFLRKSLLSEPDSIEHISAWLNVPSDRFHYKKQKKLLTHLIRN